MMATGNFFTFDGVPSTDFRVGISGKGTFTGALRRVDTVKVPGRNGDLTFDNGAYDNVDHIYKAYIAHTFRDDFGYFRAFMMAHANSYYRLEDTYHPEEFYLARFAGRLEPETMVRNRAGTFDIEFNRKPQRFLKSGEDTLTYTQTYGNTLYNPTLFDALPLIRVYGTGAITINGITITVTAADGYTDIDCDTQNAFKGAVNCNENIVRASGEFFKLSPGQNNIGFVNTITSLQITPRWYTI